MNIIKQLFIKRITFAVEISFRSYLDESIKEYSILLFKDDIDKFKDIHVRRTGYVNVYEYDMNISEIAEFKANMGRFTLTVDSEHGRVYELKNNSFKRLHEAFKIQ
jgi:hypothetical protein